MTDQGKFRQINRALLEALPELTRRYDEEIAAWGEEMGPHVIYGDVLNPFLLGLLDRPGGDGSQRTLRRAFAFLDEMLDHPDPEYVDVVQTAVAEELEGHPELLLRARPFMGPLMAHATRDSPGPRRPSRLRDD